ncbi:MULTISPECIES: IS66-like element ISH10B family transposase [Halobacteriales]|uniref:ISH10-type transposase ISH10 n=7 Tax=Halobacterium salinarum TaxID=2242 RepID=A0A510N3U3_HALSA|nr:MULTISPECIES: IS66-like element ISH10B family transposase [Halobacteriales]MBB6091017.1 transposase [Halobacterium salinarum]MDL0141207.1 IS66-like element ISH10B family transposase [Halobacterium salinarum]MDL0146002.1 IS66-like element ISH10B family transposase [Halobacterium salinarum]QCC46085.1 ISH10-type transposase ISH10 [Halobacterium salinarum]UEB92106.1 IS66-like element ISH10B family transposase [Halobacterium salinarum NRC-34001]
MSWDDLSKDELLSRFLQMEERIDELEEKIAQKDKRIEEQNERIEEQQERIEELETRLRKYENPHTPPSKRRSGTDESPTSQDDEDDDVRTDGGTPGRKDGHNPEWRSPPDPDEEIEVTSDCCPECGDHFDESVGVSPRLVEEVPDPQPPEVTQYNRHRYQCDSCGTETVATHPDCPDEGQFGVNVIAQSALSRYDHRLPYRKITDRFEQLHGLELSGASAWHATERAARAGRCEYEQIRREIQEAEIVHVDETGIKRDGDQAWIWTFRTDEHTLYAVRESRGSDVPAEVLGEDFAGTVICDGWTAYPAFSSTLQRCWAHLLREAEDVASDHEEAEPVYRYLKQMFVGLQSWLETDPDPRARAQMHRACQDGLRSLVERSVTDEPVATLLGKIEGGLDHWLTFVGEPAVSPTNNAAENALREPVVLRKIIGTLRNDRGMFVHETILSLLATWRQQGRNPYEELTRVVHDNEMISREQTVPVVETSG